MWHGIYPAPLSGRHAKHHLGRGERRRGPNFTLDCTQLPDHTDNVVHVGRSADRPSVVACLSGQMSLDNTPMTAQTTLGLLTAAAMCGSLFFVEPLLVKAALMIGVAVVAETIQIVWMPLERR